MDGKWLEPEMRGWPRVWGVVFARYGDFRCAHPVAGEVWQYMGTANGWHSFRHRALPTDLLGRAVEREVWGAKISTGDCGGWRVYDKVRVEPEDFWLAEEVA